jgi:diguanylate cyclase (GGDEF)-like protein
MPKHTPVLSTSEPDPALLNKLAWLKRALLAVVALIAVVTLAGRLIPALGRILPDGWQLMEAESGFAALFSSLSLQLSEPRHSRRMHRLSLLLAVLVALLATLTLIEYGFHISLGIHALPPFDHGSSSLLIGRMSPQTAGGFALLGVAMILIRARKSLAAHVADLLIVCLSMLILVLVSGYVFGVMRMFGLSSSIQTSPQTLLCLLLLTLVAVFRRTEDGVFAIFLGRGIGSRIARDLSPILLVLPFLREVGRAHLVQTQRIPEHYATAILAAIATMLSFVLLMFLVWRINRMEMEIHDLSLRDELTGLYNLRGFNLLAEQELRLAQRSLLPFSVLFIDLDNLKWINDSLGHDVGSAFLVETAEILKAIFRETDVIGRVGGDEFAVVCQCSHVSISIAAQRLQAASALQSSEAGRRFPLSFSIGYVTAEEHAYQSLKELLTAADKAMYEEKRLKNLKRE